MCGRAALISIRIFCSFICLSMMIYSNRREIDLIVFDRWPQRASFLVKSNSITFYVFLTARTLVSISLTDPMKSKLQTSIEFGQSILFVADSCCSNEKNFVTWIFAVSFEWTARPSHTAIIAHRPDAKSRICHPSSVTIGREKKKKTSSQCK